VGWKDKREVLLEQKKKEKEKKREAQRVHRPNISCCGKYGPVCCFFFANSSLRVDFV
jgi:hypothetical protein